MAELLSPFDPEPLRENCSQPLSGDAPRPWSCALEKEVPGQAVEAGQTLYVVGKLEVRIANSAGEVVQHMVREQLCECLHPPVNKYAPVSTTGVDAGILLEDGDFEAILTQS